MRTSTFLVLILSMVLMACNGNRVFEEHTDPSGNLEWNKDEVVEFDVDIEDPSLSYTVTAALRYAQGFPLTELPVEIKRIDPDGTVEANLHVFRVRNSDGAYIGEPAYDIWDLEEVYQANIKFPKEGTYHYELRQQSDRDKLHMVMEVGLIVDKAVSQP